MNCHSNLFLYLLLLQLNPLLFLQFPLSLTLKNSFPKLALPLMPHRIHEESSPMKNIILPLSLIDGPIRELINSISMMFVILPLTLVD